MRFKNRFSQLVLNKDLPSYQDIRYIRNITGTSDLLGHIGSGKSKTQVVLLTGSNVWMVQDLNKESENRQRMSA